MLLASGKWGIDLVSPHQIYKNLAGKRVPGVTTICGVVDKPQLRRWGLGMERDRIMDAIRDAANDLVLSESVFSTKALMLDLCKRLPANNAKGDPVYFSEEFTSRQADVGSLAHAMCEASLHNTTLDETGLDPEMVKAARFGFDNFRRWWEPKKLRVIATELQMVSEKLGCGGTLDVIASEDVFGRIHLADLKTSKGSRYYPYDSVYAQVAAYAAMYEEVSGAHVNDITIVRIGKEAGDPGSIHEVTLEQRRAGLRWFKGALEVYRSRQELSRA